jgi:pimeloyl-ACP methyl ester carboxylesterase
MAKRFLRFGIGAIVSMTATAAAMIWLGNRRVDAWETLTLDDASDGDFVTLSDGTRIHYIARGTCGSPVILIHGVLDSARNWSSNIKALAQHHRVWAIDLIGFGFSTRVTERIYSLKYLARSVRDFMDAQGIERASIVGHSLGGAVALEFAHDFPTRVDRLVLFAPATYLLPTLSPILNHMARVPYLGRALIGLALTNERARQSAWLAALGDQKKLEPQEQAARLRPIRIRGSADSLVAMVASPHVSDLPAGLPNIVAPVLMIWGEQDRAVPPRHGVYHERALPNAQFVRLPGVGHIPQDECPMIINSMLLEFLAHTQPS